MAKDEFRGGHTWRDAERGVPGRVRAVADSTSKNDWDFAEPDCRNCQQPPAHYGRYGTAAEPIFRQQPRILDELAGALRSESRATRVEPPGDKTQQGASRGLSAGWTAAGNHLNPASLTNGD